MQSHQLGQDGEAFARQYLAGLGYRIEETNFRTRFGEIDIIAKDGTCLCFIEVKTRQEDGWDPLEAVHPLKQRTMVRAALTYLVKKYETDEVESRFDVLAVYPQADGEFRGELIRNAFLAGE